MGGGWGIIKGVPLVGGGRWGPGPTCGRCMSAEHPAVRCFCFVCKLAASGREGEAGSGCLKEDIIRQESSLELYLVLPFYGDMVLLEAT